MSGIGIVLGHVNVRRLQQMRTWSKQVRGSWMLTSLLMLLLGCRIMRSRRMMALGLRGGQLCLMVRRQERKVLIQLLLGGRDLSCVLAGYQCLLGNVLRLLLSEQRGRGRWNGQRQMGGQLGWQARRELRGRVASGVRGRVPQLDGRGWLLVLMMGLLVLLRGW